MGMIVSPAQRLQSVGEYYFSKKLEEVRVLKASGAPIINLGIGSPDLAPSEETLEATRQSLAQSNSHGYSASRGTPELRAAMADWYKRTYKVSLEENQILPLLGSKEGIAYISLAFLNPGEGALVPNPGYPPYTNATRLIGCRPIYYDLKEENGWLPDLTAISKLDLKGVKLMWVNYPHMPTGTKGDVRLFDELVAFGREKKILICNDNPYSLVLNPDPLSILSSDPSFEGVLELNSMSKAFNMAGWRVGLVAGRSDYLSQILQVKSNVDSGMFLAIQAGARQALRNPESWHEARNKTYAERQKLVFKIFDKLNFKYKDDQVGLFVWAKAPEGIADVPVFLDRLLYEAHIFMVPGVIFGSNGERFARSSICASTDVLRDALKRLENFK